MTHDERNLLCLVARVLAEAEGGETTVAVALRKLVRRIQRHASIESNKRSFDLAHTGEINEKERDVNEKLA